MHNMITIHGHCEMDTVYLVCLGASADIQNVWQGTPLQVAEKKLANESDPEAKQHYEKVYMKTHTYHHTLWYCQCLLTEFLYILVLACEGWIFSNHDNFAIHVDFCGSIVGRGMQQYSLFSSQLHVGIQRRFQYVCVCVTVYVGSFKPWTFYEANGNNIKHS